MKLRIAIALMAVAASIPFVMVLVFLATDAVTKGGNAQISNALFVAILVVLGPIPVTISSWGVMKDWRRARPLHLLTLSLSFFFSLFAGAVIGANGGKDQVGWWLLSWLLSIASFICTLVLMGQSWWASRAQAKGLLDRDTP
jgi:hypothetical protein